MSNCNESGCKWIQNQHDSDHWICLTCEKQYHIKPPKSPQPESIDDDGSWPLWLVIIVFALLLFGI